MIIYKARTGASFNDRQARVIGLEIENVKKKKGYIKPEFLVSVASVRTHPLHEFFEWDDNKASKEYRLHQARHLINHIVEIIVVNKRKTEVRSFHSVTCNDLGKIYVTINDALNVTDYRNQLLNKSLMALENLRNLIELMKTVK